MRLILFLLLSSLVAVAQNAAITNITGGDFVRNGPTIINSNFASLNTAKVARFVGAGPPGSVPLNLPGDIYSDSTNGNLYWCAAPTGTLAPACTSVTTGGWTKANGGSPPAGCTTAVQRNGGSGAFGGDCNFTYDGTTVSAAVPLSVIVPATGPIGTSTTTNKTAGLGLTRIFVDPNVLNDATGSNRFGVNSTYYMSGLGQPANYSNDRGDNRVFVDFNGNNNPDNSDKRTKLSENRNVIFRGSGQKFGSSWNVSCPSAGDCGGIDVEIQNGGHTTAFGDEGGLGISVRNWQPDQYQGTLTTPPVTTSTCNTTTTGSITKSTGTTNTVTVGVVSSANCNPGDLVTIDQGTFGVTDQNKEVVKIISAAGGGSPTITALFAYNHLSGVPVQPAPYVSVDNQDTGTTYPDPGGYGQDRVVVRNPASPVTTAGHVVSTCGDSTQSQCAFVGDGSTTWATLTNQGYCISPDIDQYAFQGGSNRRYYWPINGVTDNNHITVYKYNGQATSGSYTYQVVQCGQVAYNDVVGSSSALTVQGVALYYAPGTWSSGDTFLQPIDPRSMVVHNILSMGVYSGPQGYHPASLVKELGSLFRALNSGTSTWQNAFFADSGPNGNGGNYPDYQRGLYIHGNTQFGAISADGYDAGGEMLHIVPRTGDAKCLGWHANAGYENSNICAGLSGNGLSMQSDSEIINLGMPGQTTSGKLDYSALGVTGTATWELPTQSGNLAIDNPGTFSVAFPDSSGGAIELGYFPYGTAGYTRDLSLDVSISLIGGGFDFRAKTYHFSSRTDLTTTDTWVSVAPLSDTDPSSALDYRLDADNDGPGNLRLRLTRTNTSTPTGVTAWVTVRPSGMGQPTPQFVITGTTSTPSAPTSWWPTAVVGQTANKMTVTNAAGFAATIDPTALTAPRTITYDDASGHQMLANNAGTYTITGGSTVAFGSGGTVVYAVSPPSIGATFTNAGSTLVAGANTYYVRPSTGQGGTTCTIQGYNIWVDTGTASFDVWKIAAGTALPTVSNTIISGASYLAISTGTLLESTTTSALTTTTVSGGDVIGFHLQTVTGSPTVAHVELPCKQ